MKKAAGEKIKIQHLTTLNPITKNDDNSGDECLSPNKNNNDQGPDETNAHLSNNLKSADRNNNKQTLQYNSNNYSSN